MKQQFKNTAFYLVTFLLLTFVGGQTLYAQEPTSEIYNVSSLAYSPDGTKIAVGGGKQDCVGKPVKPGELSNYAIRILETATGKVLTTLEGHTCSTNSISWDSSGVYLASGGNDGSIRIWDVTNGSKVSVFGATGSDGEAEPFEGVTWNPITSEIAGFQGRAILILDPFTGHLIKQVTDSQDRHRITAIAWNPDGDLLAAATLSNTIKIWNVATDNLDEPSLSFGTTPVTSILWSPDGSRILTGGEDGTLNIFDATSGKILVSLSGHTQPIPSIAWSKDGSRIASASWDGTVRVWDVNTGYQINLFTNTLPIIAIDWSPDNLNLAYGGTGSRSVTIVKSSQYLTELTPSPNVTIEP